MLVEVEEISLQPRNEHDRDVDEAKNRDEMLNIFEALLEHRQMARLKNKQV